MPMNTRDEVIAPVQRMQECFNTRQFDQADDLFTPGFFNHALGATGFEASKAAWRKLIAQFPGVRVIAEDILADGNKVAIRSSIHGTGTADGDPQPMLLEIFHIHDGRIAAMWGISNGPHLRAV